MDVLGLVDVPTWLQWVLLLVGMIVAYVVFMSWDHNTFKKMGIDGPKPNPVFGNFRTLFKEGVVQADMTFYKKYGRIFGTFESRHPILYIAEPKLLKEIMVKQFNSFVNRRGSFADVVDVELSQMLTLLKDDHWRNVRNIMTPTFSAKKLRQMTPLINSAGDRMMENIESKIATDEDIDIHKLLSAFTMDVIASTGFGLKVDAQKNPDDPFMKNAFLFRDSKWFATIGILSMFLPVLARIPRLLGISFVKKASTFFVKATKNALKERRANPGVYTDFMSIMADAEDTEEQDKTSGKTVLTESEIASQAVLFFLAGYDTTASTLTFVTYHFCIYPDICDKVIQEIDEKLGKATPNYDNVHELTYLEMCIHETMRLFPLASRIDRVASRDVTIGNIEIPKGMIVNIPVGAIQRDPEFWPEPEKFIPERFSAEAKAKMDPFVFLPFGAGPRNCIGLRLALLEMKMAIARILQNYRPIKSPNTKVPIEIMKLGNRPKGFVMKFERRK
ncbi:cytochrome P450 3A8-like isoform X2 [Pecten maximus]|nr:cytochrome P450 3A8-like isoform X2 [Pecten maximus]XP_033761673.1 cytochrome P450 3A8-like isoform X2 [Pecten maximus]XP_033761674.1 cytochrome P450 3A8-like isoform X2 [Pecten maximus]